MKRGSLLVGSFLPLAVVACGGGDDGGKSDLPDVDCDGDVPSYSQVEVFQPAGNLCIQCHSSTLSGNARNGAPSAINVDAYDSVSMFAELIVQVVYEGAMPPANEGYTISDAQKQQVFQWGLCGAPE